jgi:hypothetical protein
MSRRSVAILVILFWGAGLFLLIRREVYPTGQNVLESASRKFDPVLHFYTIERENAFVGYATAQLDTSVLTVQFSETINAENGDAGSSDRMRLAYNVELSRRFSLISVDQAASGGPEDFRFSGRIVGDTAVIISNSGAGVRESADTSAFTRGALTAELATFYIALSGRTRVGSATTLDILHPVQRTIATRSIAIEAESLFTVADSAIMDPTTSRWVASHTDTVRAWRIKSPLDSTTVWFDRHGYVVQRTRSGGLVLKRTAFEIAVLNYQLQSSAAHGEGLVSSVSRMDHGGAARAGKEALPPRE